MGKRLDAYFFLEHSIVFMTKIIISYNYNCFLKRDFFLLKKD